MRRVSDVPSPGISVSDAALTTGRSGPVRTPENPKSATSSSLLSLQIADRVLHLRKLIVRCRRRRRTRRYAAVLVLRTLCPSVAPLPTVGWVATHHTVHHRCTCCARTGVAPFEPNRSVRQIRQKGTKPFVLCHQPRGALVQINVRRPSNVGFACIYRKPVRMYSCAYTHTPTARKPRAHTESKAVADSR